MNYRFEKCRPKTTAVKPAAAAALAVTTLVPPDETPAAFDFSIIIDEIFSPLKPVDRKKGKGDKS